MQYQPVHTIAYFGWFRLVPSLPPQPHYLPAALFDLLTGGTPQPPFDCYSYSRAYPTAAAAYADLQQAAQVLYASQYEPPQYRNPF